MNLVIVVPIALIAAALAMRGAGGQKLEVFASAFILCLAAALSAGLVGHTLVGDLDDPSGHVGSVVGAALGLAALAKPGRSARASSAR